MNLTDRRELTNMVFADFGSRAQYEHGVVVLAMIFKNLLEAASPV